MDRILCLNENYEIVDVLYCSDDLTIGQNSIKYPLMVSIRFVCNDDTFWRDHAVSPIGYDLCQYIKAQRQLLHKNIQGPESLPIVSLQGEVKRILGKYEAYMSDLIKPIPTGSGVLAKDIFKELKTNED